MSFGNLRNYVIMLIVILGIAKAIESGSTCREVTKNSFNCSFDGTVVYVFVRMKICRRFKLSLTIKMPAFGINEIKDFTKSGEVILRSQDNRKELLQLFIQVQENKNAVKIGAKIEMYIIKDFVVKPSVVFYDRINIHEGRCGRGTAITLLLWFATGSLVMVDLIFLAVLIFSSGLSCFLRKKLKKDFHVQQCNDKQQTAFNNQTETTLV